jgi:hypothetical protein
VLYFLTAVSLLCFLTAVSLLYFSTAVSLICFFTTASNRGTGTALSLYSRASSVLVKLAGAITMRRTAVISGVLAMMLGITSLGSTDGERSVAVPLARRR